MKQIRKREIWVDHVKLFACILVVLGHFFQSMIASQILQENSLYLWFINTIYLFHVPLFFICSGYLYNRYSKVRDFKSYKNNIIKKALDLGVPYFTFSIATWIMKTMFSSSVNTQADSLLKNLFVEPLPPYWFLFCLFFMFLITPTIKKHNEGLLLVATAFALKCATVFIQQLGIYSLNTFSHNYIWFVLGMYLALLDTEKIFNNLKVLYSALVAFVLFTAGSVIILHFDYNVLFAFALGAMMCFAVIVILGFLFRKNIQPKILEFISEYTMPIFLMHTIFAAPIRILLLKLSVTNPAIHIVAGVIISFAGPIITEIILKKTVYLEFFVYPRKTITIIKNKICRDYRDSKVSNEELGKLSTCDLNEEINDGLSEKSRNAKNDN